MAKYTRSYQDMLKDSKDPDIDIRIMGANDLCQYLQETENCDQKIQDQICKEFLTHLSYKDSLELRGNAVRCISKVASKLGIEQVKEIVQKVVDKIVRDDPSIRDINSTCVKTIILEIQGNQALTFCDQIINQVQQEVFSGNIDNDIYAELVEILDMLFKKFGGLLLQTKQLNKKNLCANLTKNLDSGNQNLRKKSATCLGSFSYLLNYEEIQGLVVQLIQKLQGIQQKNKKSEQIILYLNAIYSITRYSASRFKHTIDTMVPYMIEELQREQDEVQQDENFDFHSLVIESYLNILDNLVRGCPMEISKYLISKNQILDILTYYLEFDPNSSMRIEEFQEGHQKMELENTEYEDYGYEDYFDNDQGGNEEDESWRVRRASIRLLDSILKYQKQLISEISHRNTISKLKERLREKDENIRNDSFDALNSFLNAITALKEQGLSLAEAENSLNLKLKRQDSELPDYQIKIKVEGIDQIVNDIIVYLTFIIKGENNNQTIKQNAVKLLIQLCTYIPQQSINQLQHIMSLTVDFSKKGKQDQEIFYQLLVSLRRIMRLNSESFFVFSPIYEQIIQIATVAVHTNYYKICSVGFKIFSSLYEILFKDQQNREKNFNVYVKPTLTIVFSQLEKQNIDQEIKLSLISTVTQLVIFYDNLLTNDEFLKILQDLESKLENDVTREQTLKFFWKLPLSIKSKLTSAILTQFETLLQIISQFLLRQSRTLKIMTFESIIKLVAILKNALSLKSQETILQNIEGLISEEDILMAQKSLEVIVQLLENNPNTQKQVFNVLPINRLISFSKSPLIKGVCRDNLMDCYEKLQQYGALDHKQIVQKLESIVDQNNLQNIAGCIARLIQSLGDSQSQTQIIQKYIQQAVNFQSQEKMSLLLSLLVIKELSKQRLIESSSVDQLFQLCLQLFKQNNEDVRNYASYCLGGLTLSQPQKYLSQVVDQIKQQTENYYLMLNTLKEIVNESDTPQTNQTLVALVPQLFQIAENKDENIRNLVAETIGRLCYSETQSLSDYIKQNLLSNDANRRYTAAMTFKNFCNHSFKNFDLLLQNGTFQTLCERIKDQDIDVKRATFISLNFIAFNQAQACKYFNSDLFTVVNEISRYDDKLIKEISLGLFKHVVDNGLPLRNAVYSFLESCVSNISYIDNENYKIIVQGILDHGLDDPSDDIQIISFNIISKLSEQNPELIFSEIKSFTKKFQTFYDKNFQKIKNIKEGDRSTDTLRASFRCIKQLVSVSEIECQPEFKIFYENLFKINEFQSYINQ